MASTPEPDTGGGGLRASDADRERVAAVLRQHCSAGRLSLEELSERLERAYHARTLDQLFSLTNDMPDPEPHPHLPEPHPHLSELHSLVPRKRSALATNAAVYVVVNAVLIAVWAATGGGYFWPLWVILGWGIVLIAQAVGVIRSAGGEHGAN